MSDDPFKDVNKSAKKLRKMAEGGYRKLDDWNLDNETKNKMKVLLNEIGTLTDRVKNLKG